MNTKPLKAKVLDLAIHGKLLSPETVAELKKSPDYETADIFLNFRTVSLLFRAFRVIGHERAFFHSQV